MSTRPTPAVPETDVDIMGEALAGDPFPALHVLRAQGPVVWHATYRRWLVTTYQQVHEVLDDHGRFTVEGTSMAALFGKDAFISTDDRQRHDTLRNVWAAPFRKTMLETLRRDIGAVVDRLVAPVAERLHDGEAVAVIPSICRRLPTLVIARMMGVPEDMTEDVVRWTDAMVAAGPTYHPGPEAEAARAGRDLAKAGLADYLARLLRDRRLRPQDDLVSVMATSPAGRAYPDEELVQNIRQLLFAGNETTAKWLAHILVTCAERPSLQRELVADRTLIRAANEEVLRWQGVTGTLVRRVRHDTELAGVGLAEGDTVTLLLAGANRDPARWTDPDRFDPRRPARASFGFGYGLHNCLGLNLARLEAELTLGAVLDRFPAFAVAAPYHYSTVPARGPQPVVLRAAG